MSSRLATDHYGRLIAVGTCVELQGLRWVVLGDTIGAAGSGGIFFLAAEAHTGRLATGREQLEAQKHAPYRAGVSRREREQQVPDDQLDEQAAIEAARREQQREPADVLNAA